MIGKQDFFRAGVNKINRIEELDLEKVTRDIMDFYNEHDRFSKYEVVYDFVEKWSILKYDLYVKMGRKLSVSTMVSGNLRLEKSDIEKRTEELGESKKRSVKDREILEISESFLRAAKANWGPGLSPIHNTFNGSFLAILEFLSETLPIFREENIPLTSIFFETPTDPQENEDYYKLRQAISQQKKLTKAIAVFFKSKIAHGLIGEKKSKKYSDTLVNLISEIKQRCESGTKETEVTFSIHPYDFVTMSYNGLGWRSCFAPFGDYAKATLAVMADASTLVSFSSSPEVFDRNPVVLNNKRVRQMIHFNSTLDGVIFNKVYPSSQAGYEELALRGLTQAGITGGLVKKLFDFYDNVSFSDAVYSDLYPTGDDELLGFFEEGHAEDYLWNIGAEADVCMCCGESVSISDYDGESYAWDCVVCSNDEDEYDEYDEYGEKEVDVSVRKPTLAVRLNAVWGC